MKTSKSFFVGALLGGAAFASGALAQTKMMPKMAPKAMAKQTMAKPVSVTGIVAGNFTGREFLLRANDQTYHVHPLAKVSLKNVRGGDQVRVWGRPSGQMLNYANVRVVRANASSTPTDFDPAPNVSVESKAKSR